MLGWLGVGLVAVVSTLGVAAVGQTVVPPDKAYPLKDTAPLKARPGVKVEILEFDDLECPPCSHAVPVIAGVVDKYKIPVVHKDFPLYEIHPWSMQATITSRYIKATAPKLYDQFRKDVFAHQTSISSQDDLSNFTKRWFADHDLKMPFAVDPGGVYEKEVRADRALAEQIGLHGTPSIFVVTPKGWTQVMDYTLLDGVVSKAIADNPAKPAAPARKTTKKAS